jgi:hypothetical protein
MIDMHDARMRVIGSIQSIAEKYLREPITEKLLYQIECETRSAMDVHAMNGDIPSYKWHEDDDVSVIVSDGNPTVTHIILPDWLEGWLSND